MEKVNFCLHFIRILKFAPSRSKRNIYSIILSLIFALCASLLHTFNAFAGSLTIRGTPTLTATLEGDQVRISGTYQIENRGDEGARNVFPTFTLGAWGWTGDPRDIDRDATQTWNIDTAFEIGLLEKPDSTFLAAQMLPKKGKFPVIIMRHYEDLNGVHFSTADIYGVRIGSVSNSELKAIMVPDLNEKLSCSGDGRSFSCSLDLSNLSNAQRSLSVSYHLSQELKLNTPPSIVVLGPQGATSVQSQIENFSGLPGSTYAIFAVTQWIDGDIRQFKSASSVVKISNPDYSGFYIKIGVGVFIIASLLLYFFVFRSPANQKSKIKLESDKK